MATSERELRTSHEPAQEMEGVLQPIPAAVGQGSVAHHCHLLERGGHSSACHGTGSAGMNLEACMTMEGGLTCGRGVEGRPGGGGEAQ